MPEFKFWDIKPKQDDLGVLDVYIYGEIKSSSGIVGDSVSSDQFTKDLNQHEGVETINVHINSPGGAVYSAAAIYNQLKKHPAKVHTWVDGLCASAAVGIMLAADKGCRHMSSATMLMIHNPSTKAQGDKATMEKAAEVLDKVKNTLLDIYVANTGNDRQVLSDLMDQSTYMTAQEALQYNFIDHIVEEGSGFQITNTGLECNGVVMEIAAKAEIEKIKNKFISRKGGKTMEFKDFLNSLNDEQRKAFEAYQAENVTKVNTEDNSQEELHEKINELQASLEQVTKAMSVLSEEKNELQKKVDSYENTEDHAQGNIFDNLSEEVKALIATAQADAATAKQELAALREEKEFTTFKDTLSEFSNLPIQENHMKALHTLAKTNEAMFNDLKELMKVANTAMGTAFKSVGATGTDVPVNTFEAVEQRVKSLMDSTEGLSYTDALKAVFKEDPQMYEEYKYGMVK